MVNEIAYTTIQLRNVKEKTDGHSNGRLSKLMGFTSRTSGFVASQLKENGDLYQDIGDLLQKLDVFAKVAGDFAAVNSSSHT